jgi:hypothetical protein
MARAQVSLYSAGILTGKQDTNKSETVARWTLQSQLSDLFDIFNRFVLCKSEFLPSSLLAQVYTGKRVLLS